MAAWLRHQSDEEIVHANKFSDHVGDRDTQPRIRCIAESEGDLDSRPLLNWFLEEHVEEEATVKEILGRLKMIDDNGPGLLRLDEELGARPASTTEVG